MNKVELIDKAIGWFNLIVDNINHITTGNLTHKVATTKGMAIRAAEFLEKHKNDSLPEEPVGKVWHDASEKPNIGEKGSIFVITLFEHEYIGSRFYNRTDSEVYIGKYDKWAYTDDLLNLQEEPVSNPTPNEKMSVERWKKACEAACCDRNYRSHYGLTETRDDYFVDGVQWADEHPYKEPVSEYLEKAAVEAFKNIVDEDRNSFLEIFKAGAQWKEQQMMAKAVEFFENSLCCYIGAKEFTIEHGRLENDFRKAMSDNIKNE